MDENMGGEIRNLKDFFFLVLNQIGILIFVSVN